MERFKETAGVTVGITAPLWLEAFNAYVGAAIGVCTLIYAIARLYYLFKNKGER